jgi:hypothetical protein
MELEALKPKEDAPKTQAADADAATTPPKAPKREKTDLIKELEKGVGLRKVSADMRPENKTRRQMCGSDGGPNLAKAALAGLRRRKSLSKAANEAAGLSATSGTASTRIASLQPRQTGPRTYTPHSDGALPMASGDAMVASWRSQLKPASRRVCTA